MKTRASIVLTCFQVDLKRKDAEEELRKSKALSTLVAELSTVHSPRIEVTTNLNILASIRQRRFAMIRLIKAIITTITKLRSWIYTIALIISSTKKLITDTDHDYLAHHRRPSFSQAWNMHKNAKKSRALRPILIPFWTRTNIL